MPLLGRHKSLPVASAASQQQQQRPSASSQPPQPPPLCESPLFGTRRQLPLATPAPAPAPTPTVTTSSRRTPTASAHASASPNQTCAGSSTSLGGRGLLARCSSPVRLGRSSASQKADADIAGHTLGSIPKRITRRQIHYAFTIMDSNSDGLVDVRDLSQMLANLGVPIDEAILSHVMSTVSRSGEHRISEQEFLSWIGNLIQVSDEDGDGRESGAGRRQQKLPAGPRATSLVAQSVESQAQVAQQMRQRRGSGSGLALMRSLSGSGSGAGAGPSSVTTSGADERRRSLAEQQQEARDDLKAAFCVFDLDGDGYITLDEVQQGLKLLGESWTQTELNQLLFSKCGSTSASKGAKCKPGKRTDLSARSQRINIDDFVKLLL